MKQKQANEQLIIKDLGDGLVLRRGTRADSKTLPDYNMHIHLTNGQPDKAVEAWTRDLLNGKHPTFRPEDFTIVEHAATGRIVSACNLISQTWSYAGIPFGVGRPELVGTLPEYRRRGLIRAQFEVLHRWSAERGEKVQAITGIPYYYRQFGYEMALPLDCGRGGHVPQNIPALDKGAREPFRLRAATERDLPYIARVYEEGNRRWLVTAVRRAAHWRYELGGRRAKNPFAVRLKIIETSGGERVGFLAHATQLFGSRLNVGCYELASGVSWLAVTPSVLRYLDAEGKRMARRQGVEFRSFFFWLGIEHPVFEVARSQLPLDGSPYAWYIRVPDLPDFLMTIAPVLQQRLARSLLPGYSGEVKLSFYRDGLRLVFENGCLQRADKWMPAANEYGDASFPGLTFLQLLFGYRTLEELRYAFPDCLVRNDSSRALLNALFPKQTSHVWSIG